MADSPRRLALFPSDAVSPPEEAADGAPALEGPILVGDLAKATGKTVRAIHLYEDLGLLKPQDRSKGRYRLFSADAVVRVRWISKLQSLGFSLSEIQEVVREQEAEAMVAAGRLHALYLEKLAETRGKIAELHALEAELVQSLSYLTACDTSCAPRVTVDSCPTCERHPQEYRNAPDLVAGFHVH